MTGWTSRPAARWLVPVFVVAAVLGATVLTSAIRASAGSDLPPRSAAQLLADLRLARLDTATGTVVEHADLGLPTLPGGVGGDGSADFNSLINGAHTMRVWYDGPQMARIALVGALGESDVIRNHADVWIWSSTDNTATHVTLPAAPSDAPKLPDSLPSGLPSGLPSALASKLPTTPLDAANAIIAALSPTTAITTSGSVTVAGRPAYELVIAPKDADSLVGSVRIALDSARHIPLRVQIFAAGSAKPAFEVGFTQVSFSKPDATIFRFNPPPGAKVNQASPRLPESPSAPPSHGTVAKPRVIGSGWTAVLDATLPAGTAGGKDDGELRSLLQRLPTVTGGFGSGKLLETALFSALLTSDGHLFIGSVSGAHLTATASAAGK